jgi:hypothetical protein
VSRLSKSLSNGVRCQSIFRSIAKP